MEDVQKKLHEMSYEGVSGGGMVKIVVNGKGHVESLKIDPSLLVPADVEILEDLLTAAFNDAHSRMEQDSTTQMSQATGGLALPAGMKFPF